MHSPAPLPRRSEEQQEAQMGFLEHLDELRSRIITCLLAIVAGMAVAAFFAKWLTAFVMGPTLQILGGTSLVTTRLGEGFSFYFDVLLIGGVIIAAPVVGYQMWRFVSPGLHQHERRLVIPFILMASAGTLSGAAFTHYVLFPSTVAFFLQFELPGTVQLPRVEDTFGLYRNMLIGMVAVFQLPTIVLFLARLRLVTAGFLWRHVKYAVLISVVAAAFLTASPDPWNQTMVAAPILAMYLVSIGVAWAARPRTNEPASGAISGAIELVVSAAVFEQARMRRKTRKARRWIAG
jgi:sec-independent protein translocase protein TatC